MNKPCGNTTCISNTDTTFGHCRKMTTRNLKQCNNYIPENKLNEEIMKAAGELSQSARRICGGADLTIGHHKPCGVEHVSELVVELRVAADRYDALIMKAMRK